MNICGMVRKIYIYIICTARFKIFIYIYIYHDIAYGMANKTQEEACGFLGLLLCPLYYSSSIVQLFKHSINSVRVDFRGRNPC